MNNNLKSTEALKAYARKVICGQNPTNSLLIRMFDEIIDNAPTQGEWVRKEDVIHLLERWSDGYSYIEIPTDDAIKAIKEMGGGAE